jgi:hypothetical protein
MKLGSNVIPLTAIPNSTQMCMFMVPSWGRCTSAFSLYISLCDISDNLYSTDHKQSLHSVHGIPSVYRWGMCTARILDVLCPSSHLLYWKHCKVEEIKLGSHPSTHSHAYRNVHQETQTSKWMSAPYSFSKRFLSLLSVDANIFHDSLVYNTFSVTTLKTVEFRIQQSQSYFDGLSHIQESPSLY